MENHTIKNYFFAGATALFKIFGLMSVTELANLLLTLLSMVSVFMLIVINWGKFKERISKLKSKK